MAALEVDLLSSDSEADVTVHHRGTDGQGWTCSMCTLINPPAFLACSACGSARSQRPALGAAAVDGPAEHGVQPQQQQPAGLSNGGTASGWACGACTYHNAASAAACDVCGAEGPAATAAAAQAAAATEQAADIEEARAAGGVADAAPVDMPPQADPEAGAAATAAAGAAEAAGAAATAAAAAAGASLPALSGLYTLDCGCRLPAEEAQRHLQLLAGAPTDSLVAAVRHFRCPVTTCGQPITRRDLAALLGGKACSHIDSHFWHLTAAAAAAAAAAPAAGAGAAAAEIASQEDDVIDLLGSQPDLEVAEAGLGAAVASGRAASGAGAAAEDPGSAEACQQQCTQLAGLLLHLHSVLVEGTLPQSEQQQQQQQFGAGPAAAKGKGGWRHGRRSSGGASQAAAAPQQTQQGKQQAQQAPQAQQGQQGQQQVQQAQQAQQQGQQQQGRRRGRATQAGSGRTATWQAPQPWMAKGAAGGGYGGWAGGSGAAEQWKEDEEEEDEYEEDDWGADFMFDAAAMLGGIAMGGWGGSWGGGRGGGRGGRGGGRGSWGGWGGGGGGRGRHGGRAYRPKGVGYGGGEGYGGRGEGKQAAKRKAEAARRQDEVDGAAADLLQQLRLRLDSWAAMAQARLAPLPLPLLGVLLGGPLAPLLRLLLHNDSLMDVSGRRQLYCHVFQLVSCLAGSADLLPLLLQPADSDRLKAVMARSQAQQVQQAQQGQKQEQGSEQAEARQPSKRPRRGAGSTGRDKTEPETATEGGGAPADAAAASAPEQGSGGEAGGGGGDTSCWEALQALRVQADVFRRNAEQLAAEGDEDDVALVGAILDVSECCGRVQEAVDLWRASMQQPQPGAPNPAAQAQQQAQQAQQANGAGAVPTPEQRQQYEASLKPLAFQSIPLMREHYFRQHAEAVPQGAVSDRLRRVTKEIATLPGQLPLAWESGILVAMDEDRMDVLRALIFAPNETPYACGAFAFDILLPPEYPNRPPQVQFLTTGGGRVRFNPNLYENGKVCLSLLGTWAGPGWQPGQSTLLQVLVSIQSMILGTPDPYFNEPGYASMEGTAQGRQESQRYNRQQRHNTLQVAILGQLQKPPAGFEEAVRAHFRLKAPEVRHQARQWARDDASLKGLAAQVCTALDMLSS